MGLYFYFVCLLLANHVSNVILKSIDVAETAALPPAENKTIIDEGGLDPTLLKDPPVFNLGPQLVTEVKDDQTNEDNASVSDNAGVQENTKEGEEDYDDVDHTDDYDGHAAMKPEGDRIMTGNGNEDWSKGDQTQTEAPSDNEEVEGDDDEDYDGDDDTETQTDAPVKDNTETGEYKDEAKNDADGYEDDDDVDEDDDDNEYEEDHFQEYNPEDYTEYEEDYNYDDDDTNDHADSSKYEVETTTMSFWDEHKDSSNKEDDYDYDDAGEKEGYTGEDVHENIPTGVTNAWDLFDGESKVATTPLTESYWDDYSDEDDSSVEISFDDYFGEIKAKPEAGTKLEDSSKTDEETLVDTSVDAGKDMMESGHHFDNNIGMFAGTKVSNNNFKSHAFEINKSTVYAWTLFVTLFLVLVVLFIVWNRKTVSRYIVSLRGSRQTSGPGLTKRKQEDQKNLLNEEFA